LSYATDQASTIQSQTLYLGFLLIFPSHQIMTFSTVMIERSPSFRQQLMEGYEEDSNWKRIKT
jgi:hypothetical protein